MARNKPQVSVARRLHRSLAAVAAIFIIFMVLSGVAINHSNGLGLDQRHVSQALLMDWYGLEAPEHIHSFAVGSDWLSFAGSQLYLNDQPVSTISNGIGAVSSHDMLIVAGSDEWLLLNNNGMLIERAPWALSDSETIESIGLLTDGSVVVKSAGRLWLADTELLNWQQTNDPNATPTWSHSEPAPEALQQAITRHYRGNGLSLERILLDAHSGRLFGSIGVFVVDLLALIVGILAISGLVLWIRGRRNGKNNGKS